MRWPIAFAGVSHYSSARFSEMMATGLTCERLLGERVLKERAAVGEQLLGLFALERTGED
jgi:hypothetical protein